MAASLNRESEAKRFTGKEVIGALYQSLLGRKPDNTGFDSHWKNLQEKGLDQCVSVFANSAELRSRFATPPGGLPLNFGPPINVQVRLSQQEKDKLWAHVRRVWNGLGETDPYWSVLTNPKFRIEEIQESARIESFYATGVDDVRYLDAFLVRNGVGLPGDAVVAEFGCGVGRVTGSLARRFSKVLAFDVSASHLQAARERMKHENVSNVEFALLEEPNGLKNLKNIDVFFSMIVLQHNPPPIMVDILEHACEGLNPGGVAFFQAPTYGKDYTFKIEDYLEREYKKHEMEMHFLPQSEIFKIFQGAKTAPLEIRQDHCIGNYDRWISNTFLAKKEA
jgi:2-polyprenyl-3-methyl-5-hydroxy-6-metoxy-1,4-benzoquinol methylase